MAASDEALHALAQHLVGETDGEPPDVQLGPNGLYLVSGTGGGPTVVGGPEPPQISLAEAQAQLPRATPPATDAFAKAATIGASRVGERYAAPSLAEILAMPNPLIGIAEYLVGAGRPRSVAAADPSGIEAWSHGAGAVPGLLMGSVEKVPEEVASTLGNLAKSGAQGLRERFTNAITQYLKPGDAPFYSRLDEAAQGLPTQTFAPKIAGLVQKGQASADELAARNVPELLAQAGTKPITKAAVQEHLAANPITLQVKTLQAHPDTITDWLERNNQGIPQTPDEWTTLSGQMERTAQGWQRNGDAQAANRFFGFAEDAGRHAEGVSTRTGSTAGQPKFSQYQLPGGTNYKETLITLPTPKAPANQELQSAFTQANLALNAFRQANPEAELEGLRNEGYRRLVLARNRLGEQLSASENAHVANMFRSAHFDEPNILVHTRSNTRDLPGVGSGTFLEEVQSDWHQKGKKYGYQTGANVIDGHNYEWWNNRADSLFNMRSNPNLRSQISAADMPRLEYDLALARENRNRLSIQAADVVPNAPFKDTWPDLALKHHLAEASVDPNVNWLGFTSGETQAARYDLSKQVSKLTFEPNSPGDYSLGTLSAHDLDGSEVVRERNLEPKDLDEYIGKEAVDNLRRKVDEHAQQHAYERDQWSVGHDTDNPKYFHIYDPNGEPLHTYDGALEHYRSAEDAQARIDELLRDHAEQSWPTISGLDLQVGGEGMHSFYDNLLPKRLAKIVKPFGGTVEQVSVPTGVGRPTQYADFHEYQAAAKRGGDLVPAWIVKLTPEMKARILKSGLALMTGLGAAGAALVAPRRGAGGDGNAE